MSNQNGKGSKSRPKSIDYKTWEKNWEKIFKKKSNNSDIITKIDTNTNQVRHK